MDVTPVTITVKYLTGTFHGFRIEISKHLFFQNTSFSEQLSVAALNSVNLFSIKNLLQVTQLY